MPELHPFITDRWSTANAGNFNADEWFLSPSKSSFLFAPNKDITSIFLGTFPTTHVSTDLPVNAYPEFFYGSPNNNFWPLLGELTNLPAESFSDRIAILRNLNMGITDILRKVKRVNNNGDSDLQHLEYNDLIELKIHFPRLQNIFMTSGGKGPISNLNDSNKSAATWLRNSLLNKGFQGFNQLGFKKVISNTETTLNLKTLASPSNSANRPYTRTINNINRELIDSFSITDYRRMSWSYWLREIHLNNMNIPANIHDWHQTVLDNEPINNHFEH